MALRETLQLLRIGVDGVAKWIDSSGEYRSSSMTKLLP